MEIKNLDIKDLKALAYDVMSSIQKLQNDLMNINNEIVKKMQLVDVNIKKEIKKEKK